MPLTASQRRYLRGLAHALKPVVTVGSKGLTPGLLGELDVALDHHELIKVRLAGDRAERARQIDALQSHSGAQIVHTIGGIVCLYRANAEQPKLALPA